MTPPRERSPLPLPLPLPLPTWRARAVAMLTLAVGCASDAAPVPAPVPSATAIVAAPVASPPTCSSRVAAVRASSSLPGAPAFDAKRADILGRARGEPMVFVREPTAELVPRLRAELSRRRRDPAGLRAVALREGYLYTNDPDEALLLATELHLADLFDDDTVFVQRGAETMRATKGREQGLRVYRLADGPRAGQPAELLFGDRVSNDPATLATPLHRDLRSLAELEGFDRATVAHATDGALVLEVRVAELTATALVTSDGARLSLACLDAAPETLAAIDRARAETAPRRLGLARLSTAITAAVDEVLRFDRPEGEKTAERDGQLRPVWLSAYLHGQTSFSHEGTGYAVFDARGRPWPPEVCVDLVLDCFERASGTWFRPRGEAPGRVAGALDFDTLGISNRRGVLAFEKFAGDHPELFATSRVPEAERVPFQERARFFAHLVAHADDFRAGDVTAIQGRKRDGLIHQHAILIEHTDPVTGFPYGLADQMKRPRRRTWEGIMAEAPLRSVLYRVRPSDRVLAPEVGRLGARRHSDRAASISPCIPDDPTATHRVPHSGRVSRARTRLSSPRFRGRLTAHPRNGWWSRFAPPGSSPRESAGRSGG